MDKQNIDFKLEVQVNQEKTPSRKSGKDEELLEYLYNTRCLNTKNILNLA